MEQEKVAIQIPTGPQRIRGIAGSGKTVVMAMKSCMDAREIPSTGGYHVYVLYSRPFWHDQEFDRACFDSYWTSEEPNWNKLRVMHGWGAKDVSGVYSTIAHEMGRTYRTYSEARELFSYRERSALLGNCCQELLDDGDGVPQLFDAILS